MGIKKTIGEILVEVHKGDITSFEVSAIVNAANSALWMGSGVAGAIKSKGGTEIEAEAMAKGPILPGQAVITTAGKLPAKYVIHCAGMAPGEPAKADYVRSSVTHALQLASDKNLDTISFPAIGAGVGGLTHKESAMAILEAVSEYANGSGSVKKILLIGYEDKSVDVFKKTLRRFG
ncbi:MAG: hypothetical protein GF411_01200 [Candidatus Lokiarchaeota archaeon]|nr:hypothetical protein [Candidatus Lokiarchaeota archaeon]